MACELVLLRHQKVSTETIEVLQYLLNEARAGRVIGLAFVALHRMQDYSTGIVGDLRSTPTLTRGMVKVLDDEVATLLYPRQA